MLEENQKAFAQPVTSTLRELLRDAEKRVRVYGQESHSCALLDAALRRLGLKISRYRQESKRFYEQRLVAEAEVAEYRAAATDCAGQPDFEEEYVRARMTARHSPEMPRTPLYNGQETTSRSYHYGYFAERQAIHRERRKKHVERLGARFMLPEFNLSEKDALQVLLRHRELCLSTLRNARENLELCRACDAKHAFASETPMTVVDDGSLSHVCKPCKPCRQIIVDSDRLKEELRIVTGGAVDYASSGLTRRRGRPRKNKV